MTVTKKMSGEAQPAYQRKSSKNNDIEDKSPTIKTTYKRQASNLSNNLKNNSNNFSIVEMKDEPVVDKSGFKI